MIPCRQHSSPSCRYKHTYTPLHSMKITAVIVTYNRLEYLRKCLPAVLGQSRPVDEVIVINNQSTDGTEAWLSEYSASNPIVKITTLPTNAGGAGGFEAGMKIATEQGADYVWIMDDDTIPSSTALAPLVEVCEENSDTGFACSRVEWTDGHMHLMNLPMFTHDRNLKNIVETLDTTTRCHAATFVSLLIPTRVIYRLGLPIGEYFIWHDDIEYTQRISRNGYKGFFVPASIVLHATASNRGATITNAPAGSEKRFYYQIRNQMATKRMHTNALAARISNWLRLRRFKRAINRRTSDRDIFLQQVMRGYHDGLRFKPQIRFPNPPSLKP